MTDLELIEQSIERMIDVEDAIIQHTYRRFFADHPDAHQLFGPNTLGPRTQMVNETILASLDLLRGEGWVHEYMTSHGIRHRHSYEVTDAMYGQFRECLIAAFREALGAEFGPELEAAWRRTLASLEQIAIEAANGRATP